MNIPGYKIKRIGSPKKGEYYIPDCEIHYEEPWVLQATQDNHPTRISIILERIEDVRTKTTEVS